MPKRNVHFDLGVLLALQEELADFLRILGPYEPLPPAKAPGIYYSLTIGSYRIVARQIGRMGLLDAARATRQLLDRFSPRLLVLLGIAGGLDPDLRLGDIVVASEIEHYLYAAKTTTGKFGLQLAGRGWPAPDRLLDIAQNFEFIDSQVASSWRASAAQFLAGTDIESMDAAFREKIAIHPSVRIGPIASGDIVGVSDEFRDILTSHNRKFLALEMEAAGPASETPDSDPSVALLTIRGISDFCSPDKGNLDHTPGAREYERGFWRRYALHNAANFLKGLLSVAHFEDTFERLQAAQPLQPTRSPSTSPRLRPDSPAQGPSLLARRYYPRMELIIGEAKHDLFISGINLEGIIPTLGALIERLDHGVSVKLLALDPDGATLGDFSRFSGIDPDVRRNKILTNLHHISVTLNASGARRLCEIRVVDSYLAIGCIGLDLSTPRGKIIAQHYLFHVGADQEPLVTVTKSQHRHWYKVYRASIEALWVEGRQYVAQPEESERKIDE